MIPGEVITQEGEITLNADRPRSRLREPATVLPLAQRYFLY